MHINYQYLLSKAMIRTDGYTPVVLDYGCGSGGIIGEGRKAGLTIYGAETFYGGSNIRAEIERQGWLGTVVREIKNGIVPFENNFFDLIISNQVFEHIEDLDAVLREIERVLKPNGILLCLFPSKECIREGHCGIPFIHWFPKGSHFRFYYMVALRTLGLGHHKGKKSASQWANDFLQWLDAYTYYRDKNAVLSGFRTRFTVSFLEHEYITFRLDKYGRAFLSRIFQLHFVQWFGSKLFRRLACMVILAQKSQGMRLPVT